MQERKYYITFDNKEYAVIEEMVAYLLDSDILYIGSSEDKTEATLYVNCSQLPPTKVGGL